MRLNSATYPEGVEPLTEEAEKELEAQLPTVSDRPHNQNRQKVDRIMHPKIESSFSVATSVAKTSNAAETQAPHPSQSSATSAPTNKKKPAKKHTVATMSTSKTRTIGVDFDEKPLAPLNEHIEREIADGAMEVDDIAPLDTQMETMTPTYDEPFPNATVPSTIRPPPGFPLMNLIPIHLRETETQAPQPNANLLRFDYSTTRQKPPKTWTWDARGRRRTAVDRNRIIPYNVFIPSTYASQKRNLQQIHMKKLKKTNYSSRVF